MTTELLTKNIGLRGITVADSNISMVSGDEGKLYYRGFSIEDLAEKATFEETIYLLLMGRLPSASELEEVKAFMSKERLLPGKVLSILQARSSKASTMDVLQGTVPALADYDRALFSEERGDYIRSSMRLIARTAMVVAAWMNIRKHRDPIIADTELSHAGAFLHALWGKRPTEDETRLIDIMLILHADHTFNASTFATREVASTRAHLYASVAAGVGALSGALHGGANARVMEMLLSIGSMENVADWVSERVRSGKRIMGLGHAVYRVEDPRAGILRKIAGKVLAGRKEEKWYLMSQEVERLGRKALREQKGLELYPNVDFYSGPILYALGLPPEAFPAFFALSRVSGWCAHIIEERFAEAQPKPALYRPRAYYTGRFCGPQGCEWVPLEQRGAGCPSGKEFDGCDEAMACEEC